MPLDAATKNQLSQFGRTIALLFNRSMMYQADHPFVQQSINQFLESASSLLNVISPLVFILNREQFFVDEEPLDPRLNMGRVLAVFKNNGIQSISIEPGLEKREVSVFLEIFGDIRRYNGVEGFKKAIFSRGVTSIKVNHVRYKKITEDDEVISREALKEITPQVMSAEEEAKTRKMFMDTLLESVLTEEFAKTLNIESLMANPGIVSQNMIQADLQHGHGSAKGMGGVAGEGGPAGGGSAGKSHTAGPSEEDVSGGTGGKGAVVIGEGGGGGQVGEAGQGDLLFQQLEVMHAEVEKHIAGKSDVAIEDLAGAVFDMKKQLLEGIEVQKTLGVAYENEADIVESANELTDNILIELIKEEYQKGEISTARMAQILRRLVPEADELKRLLPKIKAALLEQGMSHTQYLEMVQALSKELQGEGLAAILQESGDEIGVEGSQLIAEFKQNPEQAAQLIYLASEIRKGDGDNDMLVELLADYVEQMGGGMALDQAEEKDDPDHLKQVVTHIESNIVRHLGKMDVETDVIAKLEKRLNDRMESVLEKMRTEWIQERVKQEGSTNGPKQGKVLSVLQTLEQSVSEHDELGQILKIVREKVDAGEIDENNYKKIQDEISFQKKRLREKEAQRVMPTGVIKANAMAFILDKEIARANRYPYSFSILAFSMVRIAPRSKVPAGVINNEILVEAVLALLAETIREVDIVGQMGKNTIVVVLPMIEREESKKALNRLTTALQGEPIDVNGYPIDIKFAGIAMTFDGEHTPDSKSFVRVMSGRLQDMANRLKNVQSFI